MACNVKRYKIQKYCPGDFRHIITIQRTEAGSGFSNNIKRKVTDTYTMDAIIQSQSGYQTADNDTVDVNGTHMIIIAYYPEYENIVKDSQRYIIQHNDYVFMIIGIDNEDFDSRYIKIKARLRTNVTM